MGWQVPGEAVDSWLAVQPALDPQRLLPALLRYGEPDSPPAGRAQALRYVQHCLTHLGTTDQPVHNLAVSSLSFPLA